MLIFGYASWVLTACWGGTHRNISNNYKPMGGAAMHMGQWKCLCLRISSRFFSKWAKFLENTTHYTDIIHIKCCSVFVLCHYNNKKNRNLKGLQFDYCENWITDFIQAAGASLHSLLTPYSLLIYRSDNYLKYFPLTARKFRAQQKNMSHKHQKNARNYFGVCCHACLFHRHHLFNTRRVQLFITSTAMA